MMHQHRPSYEVKIFLHLNPSYEFIKHVKKIAVSAISTAKDICTNYIVVDLRVGIFPFNVNKCDVTDMLLPYGAAEVSFQPAQPTKRSFCRISYDSGKLC